MTDHERHTLGRFADLSAAVPDGRLTALVVRAGFRDRLVAMDDVAELDAMGARVRPGGAIRTAGRVEGELLLARDLFDRVVIDRAGARVVRVDDVAVQMSGGIPRVAGVEVGVAALLRRLAPRPLKSSLSRHIMAWGDIGLIGAEFPEVGLRPSHESLQQLHPADLARIVDHLPYAHGAELIMALSAGRAADVLEEVEHKRQAGLLEALPADRAAVVLNEMAPDAAADLLDDLPTSDADRLLSSMVAAQAAAVRLLLSYPGDSAGGLMTTDFVIALEGDTCQQAIAQLRGQLRRPDLVYYVYVVDHPDNRRLRGIVSLRDLLLATPGEPVASRMAGVVRVVSPDAKASEAARLMREYNLLALPVIDEGGRMLGLITADDVLDVLLPERVRRHVPRLFS